MKKLVAILLSMLMLCSCNAEEPAETPIEKPQENIREENVPEEPAEETPAPENEKVIWTIGGKDYEVDVPEKTRLENYEGGDIAIYTPSLLENPATVDLSGLSGCEEITRLSVYVSSETDKVRVPNLPNLEYFYFYSAFESPARRIDLSDAEKIMSLNIETPVEELILGKGTENLILGKGFDLSAISGGENIKSINLYGGADLSKLAEIGEIEKVYVSGEGSDIGELKNLKSMKRLSVFGTDFDLSGIEALSMENLVLGDYISQSSVDSITGSKTVTELQLSDRNITDISVIEKMPNLKTIFFTVAPVPHGSVTLWYNGFITEEMLERLETNVDKTPLKKFIQNGGEIYILEDPNRAVVTSSAE